MPSAVQNNQCSITNNSGKDIVIALALTADESATSSSVSNGARQLEVLKTGAGDPVIKNDGTATITLDRTYTAASGASGPVPDYELLVCDDCWLSPLACLPVSRQPAGATGFPAQTITKSTLAPLSQAITFYQTFYAYPEAQLSQNYMAALDGAKAAAKQSATAAPSNNGAASLAASKPIEDFFGATKEYQQVNMPGLAAVTGYYNNFPAVWAQYADRITYYLYSTNEESVQFAGTLLLENPDCMNIGEANGGYTCRFVPAMHPADTSTLEVDHNRAVELTYEDGLFSDDAGAATPRIALQGAFYPKRYFDGTIDDNHVIVMITGQVDGTACLGYDKPWLGSKPKRTEKSMVQQTGDGQGTNGDGKEDGGKQSGDTDSDNIMNDWRGLAIIAGGFAGGILVLTLSGLAIARLIRYLKYKNLKELLNNWDQMDNLAKKELARKFRKIGVDISDEIGYDFTKQQAERTMLLMQRERLGVAMVYQRQALKDMLRYTTSGDNLSGEINVLDDKIYKSQQRLTDPANNDKLLNVLPEELQNVSKAQTQISAMRERLYDTDHNFRPQYTDAAIIRSAALYDSVEKVLKEKEEVVEQVDPVEYEV